MEEYNKNDCFRVCLDCGERFNSRVLTHIKKHGYKSFNDYLYRNLSKLDYLKNHERYPRIICGCCGELLPDIKKITHISGIKYDDLFCSRYICQNSKCEASEINPKAPVTELKMIMFYGKKIGIEKWNQYCNKQSESNSFEYKNKKYGMNKEEFDKYNKSRAVTEENLILRHGKEKGLKIWKDYCSQQSYTNTIEYFQEKYGIYQGEKEFEKYCLKKSHTIDNYLTLYKDKEIAIKNLRNFFRNRISVKSTGKLANKFFSSLLDKMEEEEKIHVETYCLTKTEYPIYDDNEKCVYLFDFKYKNKLIEFDEMRTHNTWRRKIDKIKTKCAESNGFELLRITDKNYNRHYKDSLNIALKFLRR